MIYDERRPGEFVQPGGSTLGRIYIDIEESPNCDYHPMQTFETRAPERQVNELWVPGVSGKAGPHLVTGWSSDDDGSPCPLTLVEITDSGAAVSLLVAGGDYGLRIKAEGSGEWSLDSEDQWGEPYMLLDPGAAIRDTSDSA